MHQHLAVLVAITVQLTSPGSWAQASDPQPDRPTLAVMPLAALHGIAPDIGTLLTDTVTFEIERLGAYEVISADDINTMLGVDRLEQAMGCEELSCAVELAGSLNAGLVVSGTVGKLGENVTIKLTLFDMGLQKSRKRARRSVPLDENLFEGAVAGAVRELFGLADSAPSAMASDPSRTQLRQRLLALKEQHRAKQAAARAPSTGASVQPPAGAPVLHWPGVVGHATFWPGLVSGLVLVPLGIVKARASGDRYRETGEIAAAEENHRWSNVALRGGIAAAAVMAVGLVFWTIDDVYDWGVAVQPGGGVVVSLAGRW